MSVADGPSISHVRRPRRVLASRSGPRRPRRDTTRAQSTQTQTRDMINSWLDEATAIKDEKWLCAGNRRLNTTEFTRPP